MFLEANIFFIEKILRWGYKLSLSRLFVIYLGEYVVNDDFSISMKDYIFITKRMIDRDGKLIIKFKEVPRFYSSGIKKLKNTHNFPDKVETLMIQGTGITDIDVNHVESSIHFDKCIIKTLKINSVGKNFHIYADDLKNLKTLAYIPTSVNYFLLEPFRNYSKDGYANLTFEDTPRTQLYVEMLFIFTRKDITGLIESNISNPNHYYSRLLFMMTSDRNVFGSWEHWKNHINNIEWPEGFLDANMEKSLHSISKFNL